MTEEEKRALALAFFEAEKQRLNHSNFRDHNEATNTAALQRLAHKQKVLEPFAQNGITFQQYAAAYNEAYKQGQRDMLVFNFSFFYASAAIAFKEFFPDADSHAVANFVLSLPKAPEGTSNSRELAQLCLSETGMDFSWADAPAPPSRRETTADRAAIERMKRTGITQKDLDEERAEGYADGRAQPFKFSSCFATIALVFHRKQGLEAETIDRFIDRVRTIMDEEISTADIIDRAKVEAGVDVSELSQIEP